MNVKNQMMYLQILITHKAR